MKVNNRDVEFNVNNIFPERWSARAMSGEGIKEEELMSLFEAARWAPSAFNGQPWIFIYAKRETKDWQRLFDLLGEFNQVWCKNAAVLAVLASNKKFDYNGKDNLTHSLDSGAAWENLALQGVNNGLVVHGMAGFDYKKAENDLEIPKDHKVEMMIAIGKPGKKEKLSEDLQNKEIPTGRKKVSEFIYEGKFKK